MLSANRNLIPAAILTILLGLPARPQSPGQPAAAPPATKQNAPANQNPAKRSATSRAARPAAAPAKPARLTDRQRALHALNRLTFGPRPGEVEKVLAQGVDSWIEDQLHPESIDNHALDARLAAYPSVNMSQRQLVDTFPPIFLLQQAANGKRPLPTDPLQRLVYSVQVAKIKQQTRPEPAKPPVKAADMKPAAASAEDKPPSMTDAAMAAPAPTPQEQAQALADKILALPKPQRLAALESEPPEKLIDFPNLLRGDQRDRLNVELAPAEREIFYALANPTGVVGNELQQAKLLRAALSERQLQEVMTDFWFNHFNVFLYKGADTYFISHYERDVIRPRALGKFRDLLVAVAQSPAMLFYLDNWLSVGPHSPAAGNAGSSGLNENYARELMELHTLGVDGGYTQADVIEVAKCLTGWTIAQLDQGGAFQFAPRRHEPGDKKVLGLTIYQEGENEGLQVLDMLAVHPSTAHFISRKLAQRFLADDPPEALVRRMADTFLSTDGDIREVLRTLFRSPEFWSPQCYRAKLKTPLEFVVSAVRASGAEVLAPGPMLQALQVMGMAPYGMDVPTGYSMKAESWDNTGDLLNRLNFATRLGNGQLGAIRFDPAQLVTLGLLNSPELPQPHATPAGQRPGLELAIAYIESTLLADRLTPSDEAAIRKQLEAPEVARQMAASPAAGLRIVVAYVLASPEFQRR